MPTESDSAVAPALGALLTLALAAALVGVRGEVASEIVVLLFALVVVVLARFTSRSGAIASALMAAASFDFFFTKPYLSLKIADSRDIAVTVALLAVGLVASGLSTRATRDRRIASQSEFDADAIDRILEVAATRSSEDVQIAVRVELLTLLHLSDCWFSVEPVALPALGPHGSLSGPRVVHRGDGFELPHDGVLIPVEARGTRLGALVCMPVPGDGISLARRRTAVVAARILGLAMTADRPIGRRNRG